MPSIFASIRVFSNELALRIRWPKYLAFHPFHHSGQREKIPIYKLGSRPGLSDLESSGTLILEICRLQSMGSLRVGHDWATWLFIFCFHALEKEMAPHSSILAWRIPGMEEPGGLPSLGSHRVGHDWSDLAAAAVSRTDRNKCLLFKSSSVWRFCVAAWTDWDNIPENGTKDLQVMYLINLVSLLCEEFFYFSNIRQIFFKMDEEVEYTILQSGYIKVQ